jgi:hypothetical protein
MNAIIPSKVHGGHTYHALLQSTSNSLQPVPQSQSSVAGQASSSFQEVDMQEQFQTLENLENVTGGDQESDIAMMLPPSFDPTSQPPFIPLTPGVSSIRTSAVSTSAISKGKHKDTGDHDNSVQMLVCPPGSSKSLGQSPSALGQLPSGGRSVKSAHVSTPEAVQQMGTDIQELTKGLTTSFDHATKCLGSAHNS